MKSIFRTLIVTTAVLGIPALVRAQVGCSDSPEDPTVALVLIASAGVLISQVRTHLKARLNSGKKKNQI